MTHFCRIALITLTFLAVPYGARADDDMRDDALVLARICVSEAGFPVWDSTADAGVGAWRFSDDCRGIYEALRWASAHHNMRFSAFAQRYAHNVFDEESSRPRAYVGDLEPNGRTPRRWPPSPHVDWSRFRQSWLALYRHAQYLVAGAIPSACEETPTDWAGGSTSARLGAAARGMHEVSCGQSSNRFYIRDSVWQRRRER